MKQHFSKLDSKSENNSSKSNIISKSYLNSNQHKSDLQPCSPPSVSFASSLFYPSSSLLSWFPLSALSKQQPSQTVSVSAPNAMSLKPSSFLFHLTTKKNSTILIHRNDINDQLKMIERAGKKLGKAKSYFNIEYLVPTNLCGQKIPD